MRHTPGPWKVAGSSIHANWESGELVSVAMTGVTRWTGRDAVEQAKEERMHRESYANAQLIAAAPELMAALKDAVESLKRLPDVDGAYRQTCINEAEKAIRKAEGQ